MDGIMNIMKKKNIQKNQSEDFRDEFHSRSPGKTIFFISRNQDSSNLYHGGSEFVNVISMLYSLDINTENIQVVFLESITLNDDPFYDLYKNLISRRGEPIYIKNLKKNIQFLLQFIFQLIWILNVLLNWKFQNVNIQL